jgi:steroid delta-isomerase-like uncharacterized protein
MNREQMDALVSRHLDAERVGDVEGAVSVYTDDIEHDVVGWPTGRLHGRDRATGFYRQFLRDFQLGHEKVTHAYYGEDFCVVEHLMTGRVIGSMLGLAGRGREVSFRVLHIFEFTDGRISRENVWLDSGAVIDQLGGETRRQAGVDGPSMGPGRGFRSAR